MNRVSFVDQSVAESSIDRFGCLTRELISNDRLRVVLRSIDCYQWLINQLFD